MYLDVDEQQLPYTVRQPGLITVSDAKFHLRPELAESNFYLWRITHDPKYRDRQWKLFESIVEHCRLDSGAFAALQSVISKHPVERRDSVESFFYAETLKYIYLTFADDTVLPLDRWVFNTEAHPLPVITDTFLDTEFGSL